jgi:hypothetical protein
MFAVAGRYNESKNIAKSTTTASDERVRERERATDTKT